MTRGPEGALVCPHWLAFVLDGAGGIVDKVVTSSPKTRWLRMNASVLERVAARLSRAESEGTP